MKKVKVLDDYHFHFYSTLNLLHSSNSLFFIPLDYWFAKEEKKKVKVPDYHFHSDSSLNLLQSLHFPLFHPLFRFALFVCEGGKEEEGEGG
jgi:hypothetical protein